MQKNPISVDADHRVQDPVVIPESSINLIEIRKDRWINIQIYECHSISQNNISEITSIFLIHGSMASKSQFDDTVEHLKTKTCRIITYDFLGCGQSAKPYDSWFGDSNYNTDNLFLDALEIFKRYKSMHNILIGHSFGTTLVARIIHRYASANLTTELHVDGIILLGTTDSLPKGGRPIFILPVFILEILHPMLSAGFADRALSPSIDPKLKVKILSVSGQNSMHVVRSYYRNFEWASPEIWQALANYNRPILQVHGIDDKLLTHENSKIMFEKYFQNVPKSQFVTIEHAAHQLMQEKPAELNSMIESFINNNLNINL